MVLKTIFRIFFLTSLLINQTFSAIFMRFGKINAAADYDAYRTASLYRGLLLSYPPEHKNKICMDMFYAQLYAAFDPERLRDQDGVDAVITDGASWDGHPQHDIIVGQTAPSGEPYTDGQELFFRCFGFNFPYRDDVIHDGVFYISSAFRTGLMYSNYKDEGDEENQMVLEHFMGLSPQYIPADQAMLEEGYLRIRRIMKILQGESPEYVRLIESRDDLTALSTMHRHLLCASILSAPTYRDDRLEFSRKWIHDSIDSLDFEKIPLSFEYQNTKGEDWMADGVPCMGFVDADDINTDIERLLLIHGYDNNESVFVLKEKNKKFVLDKFFQKVPILMNPIAPVDEDTLTDILA